MAEGIDVGTLTGKIVLDDFLSDVLAKVDLRIRAFEQNVAASGESMTKVVAVGAFLGNTLSSLAEKAVAFGKSLVQNSIQVGARLEQLALISVFLGEKAGYTKTYINDLSAAIEKSGITGTESRNAIIQLEKAHVDLSKASQLSAVAQNMATLSGEGSSETYGMMIRAVTTLDSQLIRSAGFTFTMDQVLQKYTETTGKSSSAMSMHAKQGLLVNAMLEEGIEFGGLYDLSMGTAAKQLASAGRVWLQVGEVIGTAFLPITNVAIGSFYKLGTAAREAMKEVSLHVGDTMKKVAGVLQTVITKTSEFTVASVAAGAKVMKAYEAVPDVFKFIGRDATLAAGGVWLLVYAIRSLVGSALAKFLVALPGAIMTFIGGVGLAFTAVAEFAGGLLLVEGALGVAATAFAYIVIPIAAAVAAGVALYNIYKLVTEGTARAKDETVQLAMDQQNLATINKATGQSFATIAEAVKFVADNARNAAQGYIPLTDAMKALSTSIGDNTKPLNDLENSIIKLSEKGDLSTTSMKEVAQAVKNAGIAYKDLPPAVKAIVDSMDIMANRIPEGEITAFSKKVTTLWESLINADEGVRVIQTAFERLTPEALTNVDTLAKLIPELDKITASGGHLSAEMIKASDAFVWMNLASIDSQVSAMQGQKITLQQIEGFKAMGWELKDIARHFDVSTEALQKFISFAPRMEALTEAHQHLSREQAIQYQALLTTNSAMLAKEVRTLALKGVTTDMIEAMKQQGLTEQQIATSLDTTTAALAKYNTGLSERLGLTRQWAEVQMQELKNSGATTLTVQKAQIATTLAQDLAGLDKSNVNYKENVAVKVAMAKAQTDALLVDSARLGSSSRQQAVDEAEIKKNTLERALADRSRYSTATITLFKKEYAEARFAVDNFTSGAKSGLQSVNQDLADQAGKVRTLSGEYITLAEAKARSNFGGSQDVSSQNFAAMLETHLKPMTGHTVLRGDPWVMAKAGYSYAEIIKYIHGQGGGKIPPPAGPRIPGFEGGVNDFAGGEAWVGEKGKEKVILPPHSSVQPYGMGASSGVASGRGSQVIPGRSGDVVNMAKGSVVVNYPIMNDRTALDQVGKLFGKAVVQRMSDSGVRLW